MQIETLHNAGLDFRQTANDRYSLKHDGKWAMPSSDVTFLSTVSEEIQDKSDLTPPSPLAAQLFSSEDWNPPCPPLTSHSTRDANPYDISLPYPPNAEHKARRQHIPLLVFGMTWLGWDSNQ